MKQKVFWNSGMQGRYIYARFSHTDTAPAQSVRPEKTVAAASGVFGDVYSEEPSYHRAEELWDGLKHGDKGARLLFTFFSASAKKRKDA